MFPALNRRADVYITLINTASAEGVQSEGYQHLSVSDSSATEDTKENLESHFSLFKECLVKVVRIVHL